MGIATGRGLAGYFVPRHAISCWLRGVFGVSAVALPQAPTYVSYRVPRLLEAPEKPTSTLMIFFLRTLLSDHERDDRLVSIGALHYQQRSMLE